MYNLNSYQIFLSCLISLTIAATSQYPQKMIVNIPVANLREIPQAHPIDLKLPTSDLTNPLQVSQLLLGEQIIAYKEHTDANQKIWIEVGTIQQEYFNEISNWHPYPGWIEKDHVLSVDNYPAHNIVVHTMMANIFDEQGQIISTLSIGTRLCGQKISNKLWQITLPDNSIAYINDADIYLIHPSVEQSVQYLRYSIMAKAMEFVGNFYSWGGRSAQHEAKFGISSVDCSSLVHLSFLAHGLQLPRMSHEQFLRSNKIQSGKDLQPGDLVFFASITKHSTRMDHVMMYIGDDMLLETTFADEHKARTISFQDRMCRPAKDIISGDAISCTEDDYHVYFGTFFTDELLQRLRTNALDLF